MDERCGTCLWWDRVGAVTLVRYALEDCPITEEADCRYPVPLWVEKMLHLDPIPMKRNRMEDVASGKLCACWESRDDDKEGA